MPSSEYDALGSCTPTPSAIVTTFLNRALKAVDDALRSAAELSAYEAVNHPSDPMSDGSHMKTVRDRMTEATTKDRSSSGILNTLKEKLKPAPDAWSDPTTVVEFLLFESLPHDNPTVVKQELGKGSKLTEILWNFARYKDERRLTLSQNPHFYKPLPGSKAEISERTLLRIFRNRPGSMFSRTGKVGYTSDQNSSAFVNVWATSKAIIFKGSCPTSAQ
ncbi:hypothetical protein F5148DRAFT_1377460 [Russula earlei]|uniref:Uncharacterized protein n=1 Tax=Russula earlei TaxID=71964 RepID=A0ACC0U446_9AGAM|nr:hypothetical protein F5148DRAFT_1377460 [Russula earlei]